MNALLKNIRFYILVLSVVLTSIQYQIISQNPGDMIHHLLQTYAITSVIFLYFTLLAGPLCKVAQFLPFRSHYIKARRALGVSTFYFALLHVKIALFDFLGGIQTLLELPLIYKIAILLGDIAFIILFLLAVTSFDAVIKKMSFQKWKFLHRFVYLAAMSILIHALLIGEHFSSPDELFAKIGFGALSFLFVIEAIGIDRMRSSKSNSGNYLFTIIVSGGILLSAFFLFIL